ncbi:type VI secretion system tip protein VgrG [Cronobacter turicensis]|uniref:type VI secretion system Vgr family protein n=1 Tax=Cronobacter turicensis TaxID=413502 RepID=UPI00137603B1|nr:type VI secretion system tip protein VgrG [Cronobacter turicensis]EKM0378308.1 type VI secretion system tip protein VgrG [Cronobacter turicensis]NCH62967.1 type VI secretion system tip protein VgrG [Cronobacter turicensis]
MEHTAITSALSLSLYHLDINDCPIKPDVLIFKGREGLSEAFSWRIEFTAPQTVQRKDVLMKYARFDMNGRKTIYGVITRFEWLSTNADQSHYAVTLQSRLALLSRTRRCAIFQNQSVPEVVEQVLRAHGLEGPDFAFRLSREYPCRDIITQWRETDLEFIQRILAEVGIWFRFVMNDATELDVVIFGDTQLQYEFDIRLPYREPSGLSAEESVWGVRTWHTVVSGLAHVNRYNYRSATSPMQAQALQADIASQTAMFNERLKPLNQMIHAHGPQGVAFTSGEHMQLAAAKNVAINAGGDISVGVMGNMTALTGDKLGLFAHTGPLSLKSGEGPVEMQAQNGRMSLAAQKTLTMTSTRDISFAGKKRITLIGGGSYLKIEHGKIEYGTTRVYLRRVPRTYVGAATAMAVDLPSHNSVEEMPVPLNAFLFS